MPFSTRISSCAYLTHDDPVLGKRATDYIARAGSRELILSDVVVAELAIVLQRYYKQPRAAVAGGLRSLLGAPQIATLDAETLRRAIDLYEDERAFVDAYALAVAEREGCGIVSFDRRIVRRTSIERVEP
jgi:predicted nucleic acid-binding protein